MKIIVYDPLYSSMGHFYRYNKFIISMLSQVPSIDEINYISNDDEGLDYESVSPKVKSIENVSDIKSAQITSIRTKGVGKLRLYVNLMHSYLHIIKYINASGCDLCFFTSNGTLPFWLASIASLNKKFIVSAISIRSLYDGSSVTRFFLYFMYTRFLRKADLVLVTEECYVKFLNDHKINRVAVLHDRYLQKQHFRSRNTGTTLRLVTLGTISSSKNPINFIQVLTSRDTDFLYRYDIYGKSLDACGLVLHDAVKINSHIHYYDQYISDSEYISLLEKADFVVIPYDADYTKYMTSGVMWDCFERCKPIICPDVKLFRFYIEKYKIGFTYTDESLVGLIKELAENKAKITLELQCNFEILCGEISHENVSVKFKQCVSDLVAMGPCVST